MAASGRALVIGAGVGGAAAALFLVRAGMECVVFDPRPPELPWRGGLQIAPNGVRILRALDLLTEVKARGSCATHFVYRDKHGRTLSRARIARHNAPFPAQNIARGDLMTILQGELSRTDVETVRASVNSISQDEKRVYVTLSNGRSFDADVLVGVDGTQSAVRRLVFPDAPEARATGLVAVGAVAERPFSAEIETRDGDFVVFASDEDATMGYCRLSAKDARWEWWTHLPDPVGDSARHRDPAQFLREIEHLRTWGGSPRRLIEASGEATAHPILELPRLPNWHKGRVIILGDAAHALSPATGQGVSLALEDAYVLGEMLRGSKGNIERGLASVELHRKPRADRLLEIQGKRSVFERWPLTSWLAERYFHLVNPFRGERRTRWLTEYQFERGGSGETP